MGKLPTAASQGGMIMSRLIGHSTRAIIISATVCLGLVIAEEFGPSTALNTRAIGTPSSDLTDRGTATGGRGKFNGKLGFSSDRHNTGLSIWTMNADGSNPTRLTDGKSRTERLPIFAHVYDRTPVWSPDGTRIAFISNRNYISSLYVMNADGSNARLVTDQVPSPALPAWSPDGKKIALGGGGGDLLGLGKQFFNIYVVNLDGSGLIKLTSDSGLNGAPSWSPDGCQITFSSLRDADGRAKIWVMNADGSNQTRLTNIHNTSNPAFYGDTWPSWSPDGTKILFDGYRDFNGSRNCYAVNCSEIFVMNADGSNDHPITSDPNRGGIYESPKWSPDGTKIVTSLPLGTIADSVDLGRAIVVMNADGSNQINLSNRSDHAFFDVSVDWQPLSSTASSSSSVIGFSAASYSAYEDVGAIPITVNRTGDLNDVAFCFYATEDGTATITQNYAPKFGTLRFAPEETSKTISISLTDNGNAMGDRVFKVSLFDNEGNASFLGGTFTQPSLRDAPIAPDLPDVETPGYIHADATRRNQLNQYPAPA
jgi:Tol biopolymer transport system component